MKEETKHAIEVIAQNPKTAWFTGIIASTSKWIFENISPAIGFLTQLGGLILIIVLIRLHWLNGSKANAERRSIERSKAEEENKEDN